MNTLWYICVPDRYSFFWETLTSKLFLILIHVLNEFINDSTSKETSKKKSQVYYVPQIGNATNKDQWKQQLKAHAYFHLDFLTTNLILHTNTITNLYSLIALIYT